jgi:Arc/MetJ-type ribon-helix-helix transcriptional regulator
VAGDTAVSLELSPDEAELVRAALRLLLGAEDDPDTIRAVKALLARLARP